MTPLAIPKIKDKFSLERISVGLDIGSSFVKVVKLKYVKDKVQLVSFVLEPIQADMEALLKKLLQSQEIKKANISVSGPSTIIRYTDFPRMNEDDFKKALKFEAQKHIPFPVAEVNVDGGILKDGLADNKMFILLAAVKKDLLTNRLKTCEAAGIKVGIVDIDSLALVNAFNFNNPVGDNLKDKTVALLNIGAQESNLNILENGIPHLSRDIHIAGNNFTQKLADALGLDFKAAESLKTHPDQERLSKINSAVETVLSTLAREVRISFDYYESQSTSSVVKIFLSGGSVLFAGLQDVFSTLLGIEVSCWDPLSQMGLFSNVNAEEVKRVSASLAVAVGLALRS